jgi:hypothetical protein
MRRTLKILSTLAVALAAAALAVAAPAGAATTVTCLTGTDHVAFSPALTNTTTLTSITTSQAYGSALVQCVSDDPTVTTGTSGVSFAAPVSCTTLSSGPGSQVITWNNGQTSTFTYTQTITTVAGVNVATATGSITAGEFAGSTAERVTAEAPPNPLSCLLGPGVSSLSGTITLTVL